MKLAYQPSLDGLRAIAILAVMGYHFARPLSPSGYLGVDVFFVLSGYLIASILLKEREASGTINYLGFLTRRAARLIPALVVLLVAYVILGPFLWPQWAARSWADAATAGLYLTNVRQALAPANDPLAHTWSLAIEEQFYVLFPLALTFLCRLPRASAGRLCIALWLGLTAARIACQVTIPGPLFYYATPLHGSGLTLGVGLALLAPTLRLGRVGLAALAVTLIAPTGFFGLPIPIFVAEACAALVVIDPPKVLAWEPLRRLGVVSYGVYLWHMPLAFALAPLLSALGMKALPAGALCVAASIGAGAISYRLVERRFLIAPRDSKSAGDLPVPAVAGTTAGRLW
jgi:peptidoglycan/LPS O-acetylase OafA/YrhL